MLRRPGSNRWSTTSAACPPRTGAGCPPTCWRWSPRPTRRPALAGAGRDAAVLALFSGPEDAPADAACPHDADLLLTVRASTLRHHAGQAAFPGGAVDPGDTGPVDTALREAREETGIDTTRLRPLATLEKTFIPPSGFHVVPVLAYSPDPGPVSVVDEAETAVVARVPLRAFVNPENRLMVYRSTFTRRFAGPAFLLNEMLVWGFTGQVISALLDCAGWADAVEQSTTSANSTTRWRWSTTDPPATTTSRHADDVPGSAADARGAPWNQYPTRRSERCGAGVRVHRPALASRSRTRRYPRSSDVTNRQRAGGRRAGTGLRPHHGARRRRCRLLRHRLNWFDWIVVAIAAVSPDGARALGSTMSFVGVVLGAVAGVLLAPHIVDHVTGHAPGCSSRSS